MRRTHGSGSVFYHKGKSVWMAQLAWNGKRHTRQASSQYDAHVALMELRHLRDGEINGGTP